MRAVPILASGRLLPPLLIRLYFIVVWRESHWLDQKVDVLRQYLVFGPTESGPIPEFGQY